MIRAASVGGAQTETFDDVTSLGLLPPTPPFYLSSVQVWNNGSMLSIQAQYLVCGALNNGIFVESRSVDGFSTDRQPNQTAQADSTGPPAINLTLYTGDLIESMSGYPDSSANQESMNFTVLQSVTFTIQRSNGTKEEHSAGPLTGQPVLVVGPIVGFWGGVGGTFDQLGVYVDPTLWPNRPTRMLKHELHGRLIGSLEGSYFDDVIDLGSPYVLRIVLLNVYMQENTVAGIQIMYEDPMGVITLFEHGVVDGANLTIAVVFSEGDYITRLSVERGQEMVNGEVPGRYVNCVPQM